MNATTKIIAALAILVESLTKKIRSILSKALFMLIKALLMIGLIAILWFWPIVGIICTYAVVHYVFF